jgi:hypothetical protein
VELRSSGPFKTSKPRRGAKAGSTGCLADRAASAHLLSNTPDLGMMFGFHASPSGFLPRMSR